MARRRPGVVRDAIMRSFLHHKGEATVAEIYAAVSEEPGGDVPRSSIRSYVHRGRRGHRARSRAAGREVEDSDESGR